MAVNITTLGPMGTMWRRYSFAAKTPAVISATLILLLIMSADLLGVSE